MLRVSHDRDFLDRVATSSGRHRGDGPLDRICRRLFRYAGAARETRDGCGGAQAAAKVRVATESRPQRSSAPRRMTFKDRHALETLPARIAGLQADVERLNAALADADLYARDPSWVPRDDAGAGGGADRVGGGRGASGSRWR